MSSERLVVFAASAGGLEALGQVLSELPADFPAAIAIVQHRGSETPDRLVALLSARTALKVCHATDGVLPQAGTVYVCPPGMHMLTERSLRLVAGDRINFVRPNADLFLNSVAAAYGDRGACVILSGAGWDGAVGSLALARAGGTVIVQEPGSCGFSGMPTAAANVGSTVLQLAPAAIAAALCELASSLRPAFGPARTVATDEAHPPTRILLADDHKILLEGLHVLLDGEHDMEVVGVAGDGDDAFHQASRLSPDIVVMDVCMPGTDGVEATRKIMAGTAATNVVALSSRSDAATMDRILRAGAMGYLTKQRAFDELVEAIRTVHQQKVYFSSDVAHLVATGRVVAPGLRRAAR
jgi:two-component system chemotaxis response regulator CheB